MNELNPSNEDPGSQSGDVSEHQDYSLESLFGELMVASSPHQRAVLGLMAVSHCHDLPLAPMLSRLACETSGRFGRQAMYFAALVHDGEHPIDALEETSLVMTKSCVQALRVARDDGNLVQLYRTVLQRSPEFDSAVDFENDNDARFSHLLKRGLFVMVTMSFIMFKIVPEFVKMFQEFGLEFPPLMGFAIYFSDLFAKLWFLGFLILIPIGIWVARRQLRRWNPVTWRQPIVSAAARQRRLLAIESRRSEPQKTGQQTQWSALANIGIISKREARVLAGTHSGETRAWLLRWKANACGESSRFRSSLIFNLLIWLGNIALAVVVFVICAAILTALIQIIEGMS